MLLVLILASSFLQNAHTLHGDTIVTNYNEDVNVLFVIIFSKSQMVIFAGIRLRKEREEERKRKEAKEIRNKKIKKRIYSIYIIYSIYHKHIIFDNMFMAASSF